MPKIIELAPGDIPPITEPWVMVDIRRMAPPPTIGGPREVDGGTTWFVDRDQMEDFKIAVYEAKQFAKQRGIRFVYVRGKNA